MTEIPEPIDEAYLKSPQWFARRQQWVVEWHRRCSAPASCQVCGRPWTFRTGDLHHAAYSRPGAELFDDLVPLCKPHHAALHQLYDTTSAWRRLGRRRATFGIIAVLRSQHGDVTPTTSATDGCVT
jgi:hypothetical protein